MSMTEAVARASDIAAQQWGMLTTAQAEAHRVSRLQLSRLTDTGILERISQGIYAMPASIDNQTHLRAAWLALDPRTMAEDRLRNPIDAGVMSHTSAASLYGLGDLLDDTPEITVATRKQSRRGTRIHRKQLGLDEVTLVEGIPTTTPPRTVADLLLDGHDPTHVAKIIGEILQREHASHHALASALSQAASKYGEPDGSSLLERLLDLVGLSTAALAAEVAASQLGRELVTAGQIVATELFLKTLTRLSQDATGSAAEIYRPLAQKMLRELQTSTLPQITQPTVRSFAQLIPALDTPTLATSTTKTLERSLIDQARDIKQLEQRDADTGSGTDGAGEES